MKSPVTTGSPVGAPSPPPRLRDPGSGAPDAVRAILDHGSSELPDASQIARLALRLPMGTPPGSASPLSVAPAAAPMAFTGPIIGLAVAVVAIGAALAYNVVRAPASEASKAMQTSEMPAATVAIPSPTVATVEIVAPPATAEPVASSTAAQKARPAAPAEREVDLLQRAWAADPAQALAIVKEHEQRFPGGALVQEREVIAVSALVRLGRAPEARARAERFVARYPKSLYLRRIEALVPGIHQEER